METSKIDEYFEESWQIYSELGEYERHFNNLQSGYRNLASTWLLAVFAGIGFVLVQQFKVTLPVEPIIAAIALAGSTGIYLLWNLDQMVCQRLLEAIFAESYQMEKDLKWLPKVHINMKTMTEDVAAEVPFTAFLFFLAPQFILLIIFNLTWIIPQNYNLLYIICNVIFLVIIYDMDCKRSKTHKLVKKLYK